jgi:hypothetical protein
MLDCYLFWFVLVSSNIPTDVIGLPTSPGKLLLKVPGDFSSLTDLDSEPLQ